MTHEVSEPDLLCCTLGQVWVCTIPVSHVIVWDKHSIVSHIEGSAHHNVNTLKLALNFNLLKGNYQVLKNKMTEMALSGLETLRRWNVKRITRNMASKVSHSPHNSSRRKVYFLQGRWGQPGCSASPSPKLVSMGSPPTASAQPDS